VDQGTQEKIESSSSVGLDEWYSKLHSVFLQNETMLHKLDEEFRNMPAGIIKADVLMGFLGFISKCNRMMFEWVKAALDAKEKHTDVKEEKLQTTFERIDKFLEEYGDFLAKWKNEEQTIRSRVKNIGTRRNP